MREPTAIRPRRSGRRSPWFWFGWPGLIALLWAWLAFTNDIYAVSWVTDKGRSFEAGGGDGEFYLLRRQLLGDEREETDDGLNWTWLPDRYEDEGSVFMRRPYAFFTAEERAGSTRQFSVAAWAAVLAYVILWSGLLVWRGRRRPHRDTAGAGGEG